jgi:hypothetical protein
MWSLPVMNLKLTNTINHKMPDHEHRNLIHSFRNRTQIFKGWSRESFPFEIKARQESLDDMIIFITWRPSLRLPTISLLPLPRCPYLLKAKRAYGCDNDVTLCGYKSHRVKLRTTSWSPEAKLTWQFRSCNISWIIKYDELVQNTDQSSHCYLTIQIMQY